jgi:hypothetical protein
MGFLSFAFQLGDIGECFKIKPERAALSASLNTNQNRIDYLKQRELGLNDKGILEKKLKRKILRRNLRLCLLFAFLLF